MGQVRAQGTLNMGGSFLQEAAWTNATGKALEGKKSFLALRSAPVEFSLFLFDFYSVLLWFHSTAL